jgi:hypothetical protein
MQRALYAAARPGPKILYAIIFVQLAIKRAYALGESR